MEKDKSKCPEYPSSQEERTTSAPQSQNLFDYSRFLHRESATDRLSRRSQADCSPAVVFAFVGSEGVEDCSGGSAEAFEGSLGGFSQERLELGEGVLDRVEV